jgi:hypothetical protein
MNREQWLKTLADTAVPQISSSLELATEELSLKLSCGFPAQKGKRNKVSASLVPPTASEEFNAEIFVTPELSEKRKVAQAVLPLLVAVVTGDYQQRRIYRDAVRRLNLNGSELPAWAKSIADAMPAYPHASITLEEQAKQSTRLIKVICPNLEHDAYIARMSRKTLEFGSPICPCGQTMRAVNY